MWRSRSSGVRRPVISSNRPARGSSSASTNSSDARASAASSHAARMPPCAARRAHVARVRHLRAPPVRPRRQGLDDQMPQPVEALAGDDRDLDEPAGRSRPSRPRRGQVMLARRRPRAIAPRTSSKPASARRAASTIQHVTAAASCACRVRATPSASTSSVVCRRPAVSTIVTGTPSKIRALGDQIARRPWHVRDNGPGRAGECIEQARLARVRAADDRDEAPLRGSSRPVPASALQRARTAASTRDASAPGVTKWNPSSGKSSEASSLAARSNSAASIRRSCASACPPADPRPRAPAAASPPRPDRRRLPPASGRCARAERRAA